MDDLDAFFTEYAERYMASDVGAMYEAPLAMVKDFRTTYQVLRANHGWQILSYTNHDD